MVTALASAVILTALWRFLPDVCRLLKISADLEPVAMNLVLGAAAVFALEMTFGAFGHVLYGLQKIQQHQAVWVAAFVLEGVLIVALLFAGSGMYALLWAFLVRYVLTCGAYYLLVKRAILHFGLSVHFLDRESLRLLLRNGGIYQLVGAFGMFLYSVEKLIASVFLGMGAVALFDIGQKFPVTGSQVISSMNSVFLPAVSRMKTHGWSDEVVTLYVRGSRYMNVCAGLLMGFLAWFSHPVLIAWMGANNEFAQAPFIMSCFMIAFQFHVMTGPASSMHRAGSRPVRELVYHSTQLVFVGLSVTALYFSIGISVARLALVVSASMVVSSQLYLLYSNRVFSVSAARYGKAVILPGLVPYAAGSLVAWLMHSLLDWKPLDRWEVFFWVGIAGLIYLAVSGTILLVRFTTQEERDALTGSIAGLRQRVLLRGEAL